MNRPRTFGLLALIAYLTVAGVMHVEAGGFGPAQGSGGSGTATLTAIGALTPSDGNVIVGNGTTWVAESGATARTSLGLGTGDSPTFSTVTASTAVVLRALTAESGQDITVTPGAGRDVIFGNAGGLTFRGSGSLVKAHIEGAPSSGNPGVHLSSDATLEWSATTATGGSTAADTGLERFAAGVVGATDGSTGTGSLLGSAVIVGTGQTTSDIRLEVNSGDLDVREGDDSLLAAVRAASFKLYTTGGGARAFLQSDVLSLASGIPIEWTSSATDPTNSGADTGIERSAAGVVEATDGSTGQGSFLGGAFVVGSTDTNGVRLDAPGGTFEVREGDDSGFASIGLGTTVIYGSGALTTPKMQISSTTIGAASDMELAWSSTTSATGSKDLAIERSAAGIAKITDGSTGTGSLDALTYRIASTGRYVFHSNTGFTGSDDLALSRLGAGQLAVLGGNSQAFNIRSVRTSSGVIPAGATFTFTSARPAGSIIVGVTAYVRQLITSGDGGTAFTIGDGSDADRYGAGLAFTVGTATTLASHTASPLEWLGAAGDVVLTCTGGTFSGAGEVVLVVHYINLTPAGS